MSAPIIAPRPTVHDILQWDVHSWYPALLLWEKVLKDCPGGKALELGARQGGISLWLCSKGYDVSCSDYAHSEVRARPLHEKFGVARLMKYQDLDACDIPYENHFDVVVFKSILGGIVSDKHRNTQQRVFSQIHKALKPGGVLLFAENVSATRLHGFLRKRFTRWGSEWRYATIKGLRTDLGQFSSYELSTGGVAATFGRTEQQRRVLNTFDRLIFNRMLPDTWKYIAYGWARK